MITVGLDFGTHQTKVCIEDNEGVEVHYKFMKFKDETNELHYTLPSVICICTDGKLQYGYISDKTEGKIKRYFKQAVFHNYDSPGMSLYEAACYSIWYIAYILFDLEEQYGREFTVQMGAPTDGSKLDDMKAIAVTLLASAYNLVEEVFANDKEAFLNTDIKTLVSKTTILPFSYETKANYGILVFPEAYACLMPMVEKGKLSKGISMMIDIGGGTTDISFFNIENGQPNVFDFFSIDMGLNYLTDSDSITSFRRRAGSEAQEFRFIDISKKNCFFNEIQKRCDSLVNRLLNEMKQQSNLNTSRLTNALQMRPLVYSGGGSMFSSLLTTYSGFREMHQITYDFWKSKLFDDKSLFYKSDLCPILSTAYGLSISVVSDNIKRVSIHDLFENARGAAEANKRRFGRDLDDFDYALDWSARK